MKPLANFWGRLALQGVMVLVLSLTWGRPALGADPWPRRMETPKGAEVIMYQPQLESFKDDKVEVRAAFSAKTKEMRDPVFGVVWISARVSTDRDTRMVTVLEAKVTDAKFPDATPERVAKLKEFLEKQMQSWNHEISLDRLLAMLELLERERATEQSLNTIPPKIIFVTHPAVLVLLDGEPRLRPVENSSLMRVVNTPFLMLFDPAAKAYYLKGDTWLTASEVQGPWRNVESLPAGITALEAQAKKAGQPQSQPAKKVEADAGKMPQVLVSTQPAELIVSEGEPNYTPISGTNLLYLSNTESNVFMDTASQQYYVLLSGRWFTSRSLTDGPWTYVAPDKLPPDFAKIPAGSPKGFVRASVAGTQEAQDAVHETYIPQTAAINRRTTTQVRYDGQPRFQRIPGANLEYAVNTGKPVFHIGSKYYLCDEGVWYEADAPNGPWQVAVSVPQQEINTIPPTNPHYNVRYVQVYGATEDTVYTGYTPGYTGSYVQDDTVVYGTGFTYPAYDSDTTFIPYPATYGFGAAYNPYDNTWGYSTPYYDPLSWLGAAAIGFGAGVLVGAIAGNWWNHGWWGGGYWGGGWWGPGGYHNININNIHHNIIIRPDRLRPGPPPVPPDRLRPVDRPGVRPGEGRANIYNRPENRQHLASQVTQPGVKPATHPVTPGAKVPGVAPEHKAGKIPPPTTPTAKGTQPKITQPQVAQPKVTQARVAPTKSVKAQGPNNVYAAPSGNVYRQTPQGWQQRQGNNWSKPTPAAAPKAAPTVTPRPVPSTRPTTGYQPPAVAPRPVTPTPSPSSTPQQLNRDSSARQRGEVRTQNFQRSMSAPAPRSSAPSFSGGGGGGPRGGGGGGRGGRR